MLRSVLAVLFVLFMMRGYADHPQMSDSALSEEVEIAANVHALSTGSWWGKNAIANAEEMVAKLPQDDSQTSVSDKSPSPDLNKNRYRSLLEFKAGYFFFTDSKMSKVFNQGGWDLQLSGVTPVWRWLHVYGSVEYLEKHGRSLHGHQKTHLWEVPLSLGLQAVARICKVAQYYFSIGPRYIFVHVHNKSHYVDRTLSQNGFGGFVNTGFRYFPLKNFFVDVFGEYSYARMHFHAHKKNAYGESRQVGGFVFGGGLGYAF